MSLFAVAAATRDTSTGWIGMAAKVALNPLEEYGQTP